MGERKIVGTGGGLLITGGVAIWHESLAWAWNKSLDWLSEHFPVVAGMLSGLTLLPWWHVVGSLAIVAGALSLVYALRPAKALVGAPSLPFEAYNKLSSTTRERIAEAKIAAADARFISDCIIVGGIPGSSPAYRARYAKSGRDGRFYLEYSVYYTSIFNAGWTASTKLVLIDVPRFSQGETVVIPLMRAIETGQGTRWQFGSEMKDGFPIHSLNQFGTYRGRVTFLASNDSEQHCYFIVTGISDPAQMPNVLGEHMWAHEHEWEGKTVPNGTAETLFSSL